MGISEYEFALIDRIGVIQATAKKFDLENQAYISFSGGKDSTILHHLIDMALPNNKIPRVFIDTGIEYNAIRNFVAELASKDERFTIIKPSVPVIKMLQKDGYPFKSKQHSHDLMVYQHSGMGKTVRGYLGLENTSTKILCPQCLKYQFSEDFGIKISDKCCSRMKKEPIRKWEKQNGRTIVMTGMRRGEGGAKRTTKMSAMSSLTRSEGSRRS